MTQTYVSLGEQVAQRLRLEIVEGRIADGAALTEDSIAARFGVSRGPARDAFRELVTEGLLEVEGRRVSVRALNVDDVVEMCALREALETIGLRASLDHAGETLSAMLEEELERMRPAALAQDTAAFTAADLEFHQCFIRAAGLRRVDAVWQQLRPTFHLLLTISNEAAPDTMASLELHRSLADLVHHGERDAAVAELQWHLANSRDNLLIPFIQQRSADGGAAPTPE